MVEKTLNEASAFKKEQFEFILTINDNIICQRYFRINGFKRESYGSLDLIDTIEHCAYLIDQDLKAKTAIYLEDTAPQIFDNEEQMKKWANSHYGEQFVRPKYILLRNSETIYVWDGRTLEVYDKPFNRADYLVENENEQPCVLKFSFRDNGREVCSKIWDGSVYPRFIRTNIDISNSKNKYKAEGVFMPVERDIIDEFNESREDLIPILVKELCSVCSYEDADNYSTYAKYGNVKYDLNLRRANNRNCWATEKQYRKKTQAYFNFVEGSKNN